MCDSRCISIFCFSKNHQQKNIRIITSFGFCYYLIGLLTMTVGRGVSAFEPHLGLIPFVDMLLDPVEAVLNIILFIPLGFFLPLLYERLNQAKKITLIGFLLSLSVEIIQMFGMGVTAINDLIANTLGAYIGFRIYLILCKLTPERFFEKFKANNINEHSEVLFFVIYSYWVMLTIQRPIFKYLFWNLKSLSS